MSVSPLPSGSPRAASPPAAPTPHPPMAPAPPPTRPAGSDPAPRGHLQGQPRLPRPARARQRQQACLLQEPLDFLDLAPASNKAGQLQRQVGASRLRRDCRGRRRVSAASRRLQRGTLRCREAERTCQQLHGVAVWPQLRSPLQVADAVQLSPARSANSSCVNPAPVRNRRRRSPTDWETGSCPGEGTNERRAATQCTGRRRAR